MANVYGIALVSMQQDIGRVDRVAQNLANLTTPGYKREVAAARPFSEALAEARTSAAAVPDAPRAPGALQVLTDLRAGSLRMTGQPLDLAVEGDGFFEVLTPSGRAYTRQGNFHLEAGGRLVTAQGLPVLGTEGEIVLSSATPAIDAAGTIVAEDGAGVATPVARLKVVSFAKDAALAHAGGGLLVPANGAEPGPAASVSVRQGALENANVESMKEMVQLVEALRHFESMQKVVQGFDELQSVAIRRLGELS